MLGATAVYGGQNDEFFAIGGTTPAGYFVEGAETTAAQPGHFVHLTEIDARRRHVRFFMPDHQSLQFNLPNPNMLELIKAPGCGIFAHDADEDLQRVVKQR